MQTSWRQRNSTANFIPKSHRQWQQRYTRLANDLPARRVELSEQPIREVELWDLVSAFGRIIRDSQTAQPASIVYDDTPIHVYMQRIHERVAADGRVAFSEFFAEQSHKSVMIGIFLSILELVRHHNVATEQSETHGEIWILPGTTFEELDLSDVDDYGG